MKFQRIDRFEKYDEKYRINSFVHIPTIRKHYWCQWAMDARFTALRMCLWHIWLLTFIHFIVLLIPSGQIAVRFLLQILEQDMSVCLLTFHSSCAKSIEQKSMIGNEICHFVTIKIHIIAIGRCWHHI